MSRLPLLTILSALVLTGCPRDPDDTGDTDPGSDTDTDSDSDTAPTVADIYCDTPLPEVTGGLCEVNGDPATATHLLIQGILLGDSVTHDGGVLIERGTNGVITCSGCDCAEQSPAETLTVTCPDGVISPGLINSHDHIRYAHNRPATPNGTERYDHRHDWREGARGHSRISSSSRTTRETVLYGEMRMLLGGATSVAGSISSADAHGLLRNLDSASYNDGLRSGYTDYSTFPLGDTRGTLRESGCSDYSIDSANVLNNPSYLPHVSEGIDAEANNEFKCLSSDANSGRDLIAANTAIIHGIGLTPTDISIMAGKGAQLVWSPRSNISLYGMTAPVTQYYNAGVRIALGTDWTPSGSIDMLRELKCADDLNSNYYGGFFSDRDQWRMVTGNAATAMGADTLIGSLAPGFVADISIFDGTLHPDYRAVIAAELQDVVAVFRGSEILSGDASLVSALVPTSELGQCEELDVCGVDKRVCIERDAGITLSALQAAVGGSAYPMLHCGVPAGEPTCEPYRNDEDGDGIIFPLVDLADRDFDGVIDSLDNCPDIFNPQRPLEGFVQGDFDSDGLGDDCDPCPLNPGSVCEQVDPFDIDGDGIDNTVDNCPSVPNSDQVDADQDGIGAACDLCDDFANVRGACEGSVYDVKNGVQTGKLVIADLVVTGMYPSGIFTQLAPSADDYTGVDYSGIYAYMPATGARPAVGDTITIEGDVSDFYGQIQLQNIAEFQVTAAAGAVPPATVVTTAEIASDGPRADALESVLVTVNDVDVTSINPPPGDGDTAPNNQFVLDGLLRVDDHIYLVEPFPTVGEHFDAITGVLRWGNGQSQLLVRGPDDVVSGPPTLSGISETTFALESGASRDLVISLTRPATEDTALDITCVPDTRLVCPETVTVLSGERDAVLTITGGTASVLPALVHVDLGSDRETANVTVYDDSSVRSVAGFDPAVSIMNTSSRTTLSLSLDIPAPTDGTTVALSYVVPLSGPANAVFAAGEQSTDVSVTSSALEGEGTVIATLNGVATATITVSEITVEPNLFFAHYVEGSGNGNKAVGIVNANGGPVDASRCLVQLYRNGSSTPQNTNWPLNAVTLADGDEYVLCNTNFSSPALCDQTGTIDHNGDDALALVCDGNIMDVFGRIGEDPGTEWVSGTGPTRVSSKDQTLTRKCSVRQGDPDGSDAFDPAVEWTAQGQDDFTGLGAYSCTNR